MDPVAQLHSAQQRLFEALDLGEWSDVRRAAIHLVGLERQCVHPAAVQVGLTNDDLGPGLARHLSWIDILSGADHPAWRQQLRSDLIVHVAWTGSEVLPQVCRWLTNREYEALGDRMSGLHRLGGVSRPV